MPIRRMAVFIAAIALAADAYAQTGPAPRSSAAPPVRTDATVLQIMRAMVIPSTDAIFKAAGEAPTTAEGWAALEKNAVIAAESPNLLMIGTRAKDQGDWQKMSRAMADAGAAALKAVMARKADALMTASDQLYETCETCHQKYFIKK